MIVLRATQAKTIQERTKGLIGKKEITPLCIKTRCGIHTFFMSVPIDVIVLDDKNTVIALKENLKPNRFFFWNPRYSNVVELPVGTIKSKSIQKGKNIKLLFQ